MRNTILEERHNDSDMVNFYKTYARFTSIVYPVAVAKMKKMFCLFKKMVVGNIRNEVCRIINIEISR